MQLFSSFKTSLTTRDLRARRGVRPNNNLSEMPASEIKVAETDLTARVVVFPMVEVQSSNASPDGNKGNLTQILR